MLAVSAIVKCFSRVPTAKIPSMTIVLLPSHRRTLCITCDRGAAAPVWLGLDLQCNIF
jgi:hypothetical protein